MRSDVRNHFLPRLVRVCLLGLLLVPPTVGGCRRADVLDRPGRDLVAIDRLLRLTAQRLALMHDVARWKWNAGRPITDPERERELLQSVVVRGRQRGLGPDLVDPFFAAQLEAARLI
jgi:chorismate mutase